MDMLVQFIEPYWRQAQVWWSSLGPNGPYALWLVAGILGFSLWTWAAYLATRRLLGHMKIHGVWFRPGELEPLLDRLEQREKGGTVLTLQDVNLLDKYRPDRKLHLKKIGDSDFVSW